MNFKKLITSTLPYKTNKNEDYFLMDHQCKAIIRMIENPRTLCALKPGLGKTLCAIRTAVETNLKALVICPAYLKENWEREIDKFAPESRHLFNVTTYSKLNKFYEQNNDILQHWRIIILDESHYIKTPSAQRTKMAHKIVSEMNPRKTILLTGTPMKNGVPELYSQLGLLSYGQGFSFPSGYDKFCKTFCHETFESFGPRTVKTYSGVKNEELLKKVLEPVLFSVDENEVLDLPEEVIKKVHLGLKIDAELDALYYSQDHFSTKKKENAELKALYGASYIKDLYAQVGKLVVFSDHPDAVFELASNFKGENVFIIDGAVNIEKRDKIVQQFTESENAIIFCTIGAASVGINLQSANHLVFNDYPFVPADLEQASKRIKRIGQTKTCFYHYLLSGEMDEKILDKIREKQSTIGKVL